MFEIKKLIVTHNSLRHSGTLKNMIAHVENGGLWDRKSLEEYSKQHGYDRVSPLIQISRFPDKKYYLHDGHHRVASVAAAGRLILHQSEYEISDWSYEAYTVVCHENGWYTPYDVRTQCRTPDFGGFKRLARQKFESGENSEGLNQWIQRLSYLYCEPRKIFTIHELLST